MTVLEKLDTWKNRREDEVKGNKPLKSRTVEEESESKQDFRNVIWPEHRRSSHARCCTQDEMTEIRQAF